LVGELVINQAMLAQRMDGLDMPHDQAIIDGLDEFRLLTRDIQESVMAIRAQPVKPLFQRMARIVREAATATGKEVRLATSGEWTEVDKTIVERLSDPLTHMIRNAVDHGLESADQRLANGKPSEGVVTLAAAHRSGRIVIEVGDDGGGINRKKVFDVAVSKGILPADAAPTDAEIDNLLFAPGFSTASQVSDLSGRGVGMDVVKKAIQALGGRTSIASKPGAGTTFSISLPLTLAVLDGIVVSIAEQTAVLPLSNIVETLRAEMLEVKQVGGGSRVVLVRGVSIPVVDIGVELGFREPLSSLDEKVFIIVENHEGDAHAMVVDQIIDQRQVVIKGLEANYGETKGVSAATILGDGRIALILDVDVLVEDARDGKAALTFAMTG
ncbi:MAG: chemotaxis protein CheA, partial [Pseudomonadota bacterium]